MKISVAEDRSILLEEVFSGVGFKTKYGEEFGICMRDTGYEFHYNGEWWEAKNGIIKKMETMKDKINTEATISSARTVTSSKTEGEVILKYSPKNPEISNTKTD